MKRDVADCTTKEKDGQRAMAMDTNSVETIHDGREDFDFFIGS